MDQLPRKSSAFRPRMRQLALEPRVLFDGAAAVAVEQQQAPAEAPGHTQADAAIAPAAQTLVVVDSRVNNAAQLAAEIGKDKNTRVVMVGQSEDGLAVVAEALNEAESVDAIHIYSHGAAGQFTLGSRNLSADNVAGAGSELQRWSTHLTGDADILLLGCNVGAGTAGHTLITQLAALTGADVAASTNDTGAADAGGDWTLEVATGGIESIVPMLSYDSLLADAAPTVTLSSVATEALLGGTFSFTASFTNASTQAGFAPFIDLILPATGKDGAGAEIDDGITFVSATYLGQTVTSYVITFDAAGKATHPLAKDATGAPVIINAATYGAQAGDQLVVLQLPYASVLQGQPQIDVVVTCQLSELADTTGSPQLTLKARGGFQFGNNAADNPTEPDPSLFEASFDNFVVTPSGLKLTQSINMPEGETVTGPNFVRTVTVTATPPPGQTLTNVDITQTVPSELRYVSITPAPGGKLVSVTLANGSVITDTGLISQILTVSPFLSAYTVRYASLSAAASTVVGFYVPEKDGTGAEVLNPVTGDDRTITFGAPTASGRWLPLDPRDQNVVDPGPPQVVEPNPISATGKETSFVAKSVALRKTVTIASNAGSAGLSPGDELQYTLNVDLSDYFAIGKTLFGAGNLTITDQLGDGQRLEDSPILTVYFEGVQYNIALVTSVGTPGVGGTKLTFDIGQSLANTNAIFGGALIGDIAFDGTLEGATRAVITYSSTVAQAYTKGYPQSEINEGDSIGNSAKVSGTLLANNISLTDPANPTNSIEEDTSNASLTIPTNTVTTSVVTVNGAVPPTNGELKPGDVVTFKLAYNLTTGDYEQFKLTAYLPLPLFDLTGINWTQGSNPGQWTYGSGDTNADYVNAVTVGAGNSLIFDFGSYVSADVAGKRIEVQFTLTVGNQPFADQRPLTVLGQSDQLTTIAQMHLVSSGVVNIASIAEPVLAIKHGVVAVGTGSAGIVTGATGNWAVAGTTGKPFTGSITDLAAVDGSVANIDGGDLVRLATAIENTGGLGAFDVTTTVTLPTGFAFAGGNLAAAKLAIYRGDGTALLLNTDYKVSGNTITFLDAAGQPTLLPGRAGTAADTSGANLLVITYDVVVSTSIAASKSLQTSTALTNYSSANNGPDFTPGVDPKDTANQTVAAPVITKVFANGTLTDNDSSAAHTTGAKLVIGESMLYDIVVKLPEGTTQNLRVRDLIPTGLTLDTNFATVGYQIITTTAGSGALTANFAGSVTVGSVSAPGGDGSDLGLTLSATSATADNNAGNNSFVVRVRLIASNVASNQAGATRPNSAQAIYSDPDGDTPNGSTPIDRTVALSSTQPSVSIVEPTLTVTQAQTNNGGPLGVDRNDEITYTITIRNDSGINAFDIGFLDNAPPQLIFSESGFGLQSLTYAGGATSNGGPDFVVGGSAIAIDPAANIDIPTGGSITLVLKGRVRSDLGSINDIVNTATVEWSSLDGTSITPASGERSGVDGLLNSGALNDYRNSSSLTVPVAAGATISHVGLLPDTPLPTPDTSRLQNVAVGELIYYRAAFLIPEGDTNNASVVINLPTGLSFAGDTRVALVDGGTQLVSSDAVLSTNPGAVKIDLDITDLEQSLLAADLSNAATAALRTALIDTADPNAIKITLGNVSNQNNDAFFQMLYLDFFVRVDNIASVDTADNFNVSADFFSGTLKQTGTPVAVERIVEPSLRNLQKTVTDFNPNTAGATGTATVTLAFSNSGDGIAYDAHLTDSVTGGANYALSAVVINGTSYAPGSLPTGVTVSTAGGISADFSTVAIGSSIQLIYTVDVPNSAAIASTNATLDWSSLPETFTDGSAVAGGAVITVGADGTASGERDDGGTTVPNTAPNTYVVSEGAGLGIISGTLWDDTLTPTTSTTPDGIRIAGQTVTLTWAGADGDLATTGDNRTFTAITDSNGNYRFGVLPTGNFRIDAVTPITYSFGGVGGDTDNAAARIDSDGGTLGSVTISGLGEGSTATAGVGYVRDNDAPVNTLPTAPTTLEDTPLLISGISVSDVDAESGTIQITLNVVKGRLNLTPTAGVTITNPNTATVTLTGSQADLNTALATLIYSPALNYNGTDTLKITTNDLGNTGDANGNLTPNELNDALTDIDKLTINITPVNDAPKGVNDVMVAVEKGGVNNTVGGLVGAVAVLKNDTDVDVATNGDSLSVTKIGFGATATKPVGLGRLTGQLGTYGELFINVAGSARYVVDDNNAIVQALRLSGNTLTEVFTYELQDLAGIKSTATITVTIQGANDTPVGIDDDGAVYEAGGVNNSTPGATPVLPNVLNNDTDGDRNGETKNVTGIRYRKESSSTGVFTGVDATNPGVVAGSYGTLTMNYDGSYSFVVNQNASAVQRMVAGDTLIEYFSYLVTDKLGDTDTAQIKITINGANDNPVASDDQATAQAASTNGNAQEVNPTGNVILFQSRPGAVSPAPGNGIDTDVDRTDQPNSNLVVTGIRTGAEHGSDTTTSVIGATVIAGAYGTLTINPDGSFTYDVDSTNSTVIALPSGSTLTDTFTYKIADSAGLTDLAVLNVAVRGVNDPPVANDVFTTAVEAGGIANGTVGVNPSGDATANDFDPDGERIKLISIRTGPESGSGTAGSLGSPLKGTYGWLTLNADGTYTYVVDNANATVQGLRTSGNSVIDTFTYQISDNATTPETESAQIVVTIVGRNDNPIARNDTVTAIEAGGLNNAVAGSNPTGNVLTNDTDVDRNGETKTVSAIRTGAETVTNGTAGTVGIALAGMYGSLTLNADGTYQYIIDNANTAVQGLRVSGNTLTELFTYTVSDAAGATDLAQLTITIQGANDTPLAKSDVAPAIESGGLNNSDAGTNPSGNVLANDRDIDSAVNGETRAVSAFASSASVAGSLGNALAGAYGSLTLNADGSYNYIVDNTNTTVQGLRTSSNTLSDTFTYTMRDTAGATSSTTLTITIHGANDNPLAVNDTGTALEAGGLNNGTPGSNATGDVLFNDTDVDNVAYGETKTVLAIRTGTEAGGGAAGSVGSALAGTYGALTLNANGSYTYVVDNANAAVQALRTTANTLSEVFTYTMRDAAGATDVAQLTITIQGTNDTPVAVDDSAFGWPEIFGSPGSGRNPTGNVLPNDSDVDAGDSKSVSGIRTGAESPIAPLTPVTPGTSSGSGERINGTYGWLNIGADGSFLYEVDFARTSGLAPGAIVVDYFTYELKDADGLTDLAQLSITIRGKNNPPIAADVVATAVEAGGVANGSPGIDPAGDVTANDFDFEGDRLVVNAIRTGLESGSGTAGTIGSELAGAYGWLTQQADGTFTYRVDNTNPLVEALRRSGDTLTDFFTYTVSDIYGAADQASIVVTLSGANDNPVATSDTGTAVETGGFANATPGSDATGNVLVNDSDVDAYGETKAIATFANGSGLIATAGSALAGAFGSLTLNADGSYTYVVDNANAAVEALRTPADTLNEIFTYTVRDAAGATASTTLTITIKGANDNPVAQNDTTSVSDQLGPPVSTGNVLPNDGDVDVGESKTVVGIRTGAEVDSGTSGTVGAALKGRYGTLILNADGSYRYEVDLTNTEVQQSAGLGPKLVDVFTYTMADTAGATDLAQLAFTLDIAAPYTDFPAGPYFGDADVLRRLAFPVLGFEPIVFIDPVINRIQQAISLSDRRTDGAIPSLLLRPAVRSTSIGVGLGEIGNTYVQAAVRDSQAFSRYDASQAESRQGVVSLTADGLIKDVSLFSPPVDSRPTPRLIIDAAPPKRASTAPSFSDQLRQASQSIRPLRGVVGLSDRPADTIRKS